MLILKRRIRLRYLLCMILLLPYVPLILRRFVLAAGLDVPFFSCSLFPSLLVLVPSLPRLSVSLDITNTILYALV